VKYYKLNTMGASSDDELAVVEELVSGTGYDEENYRTPRGKPTAAIWPADASLRIAKGRSQALRPDRDDDQSGHRVPEGRRHRAHRADLGR
jgi:hypothetical protein